MLVIQKEKCEVYNDKKNYFTNKIQNFWMLNVYIYANRKYYG